AGAGTSESSARARIGRALNSLAQRKPSRSSKQTPGPVMDGGSRDPPGQVRNALRGMSAHATCPRPGCGAPESVRHLLWECSTAV
ncbi:hypothetical protein FQN60_013983, partial [Etheostoma spectabile]